MLTCCGIHYVVYMLHTFLTQNPVSLMCVTRYYKRTVYFYTYELTNMVVTLNVLHTFCHTLEVTHMLLQSFTYA